MAADSNTFDLTELLRKVSDALYHVRLRALQKGRKSPEEKLMIDWLDIKLSDLHARALNGPLYGGQFLAHRSGQLNLKH